LFSVLPVFAGISTAIQQPHLDVVKCYFLCLIANEVSKLCLLAAEVHAVRRHVFLQFNFSLFLFFFRHRDRDDDDHERRRRRREDDDEGKDRRGIAILSAVPAPASLSRRALKQP